jgi:hypothetical protein
MEEDVAGFDVPVHDVVADEHFERFEEVAEVAQRPFLWEVPGLLDQILECATIAELIDKVDIVGCFEYFDELDNMSGVLYFRKGLNFIDGELFKSGAEFVLLDSDDLDCNYLFSFLVGSLVYLSKFSFTDYSLQTVVLDFFSHLFFVLLNLIIF